MASVFDVQPNELIEKAAEELKSNNEFIPPEWAQFVKTGMHRERPPARADWWHIRTAAIMRTIYKDGPIGVEKLRSKYGGKKNRGVAPERFYKSSGNIIRKILQQLERAGLAKQTEIGVHKGRILTPKGKSFLDKIATQIFKTAPKEEKPVKKVEPKPEKAEEKPKEEKTEPKTESKEEKPVKKVEPKPEKAEEKPKEEKPAEKPKEEPKVEKEEPEKKNG